jgi:hypothetical protein
VTIGETAAAKESVALAGTHFYSSVLPVSFDGAPITGGGADKFGARITAKEIRLNEAHTKTTICDVYYNSAEDM